MDPHDMPSPGNPPSGQTLFPEEEWNYLQGEDVHGAQRVVGLMVGIFITGLVLYTGVALWVLNRAGA